MLWSAKESVGRRWVRGEEASTDSYENSRTRESIESVVKGGFENKSVGVKRRGRTAGNDEKRG
jgi:hypothetical protein